MTDINASIEDEVRAAMAEANAGDGDPAPVVDDTPPAPTEEASAAERDEHGRFKAKEPTEEAPAAVAETPAAEAPQPELTIEDPYALAPQKTDQWIKDNWGTLPLEFRESITRREKDVHRGFTTFDEDRNFGRSMKQIVKPFEGYFQQLNARPEQAFEHFVRTDHLLRTSPPEKRAELFVRAARDYNIDLGQLAHMASNPPPAPDPAYIQLQQQIQRLESALNSSNVGNRANDQEQITREVESFGSTHEHFERLKPVMASLLQSEVVDNLEAAYDRALYADPELRALHLKAAVADEERKRTEAATAKADKARKTGVSVTGAPGLAVPAQTTESSGSIEDDIRNAMRSVSDRV